MGVLFPPVGDTSMEKSYLGTLTSLSLNGDYAAALFDGKIMLHMVSGCTYVIVQCMRIMYVHTVHPVHTVHYIRTM